MKTNKEHIKKELLELKANRLLTHLDENQDIPNDYFDTLSAQVFEKIKQTETKTNKVRIKKIFLPLSIAATLLVLIALPLLKPTKSTVEWSQYSQNDFKQYIEQNIDDFSEEEIASVSELSDQSLFINTEYSDEELEEYLLELDIQEEELF